ncbi:MAG TPA: 3'-5' exonuclease [Saprospirales bacterium]|nr:3'-5' exonuclease [Saprospirales bacterium]
MSAFDSFDLFNTLFIDIETAPCVQEYEELNEEMQELWILQFKKEAKKKGHFFDSDMSADDLELLASENFPLMAGLSAEFSKIVCISVGFLAKTAEEGTLLRLKSFTSHIESNLLEDFSELLKKYFNNPDKQAICGHNIKEFDIPVICRRLLINQLPFPKMLDISGKKPWETKHLLDTMEMWKFGDAKGFTTLRLLCAVFDIPSPKDDISGADVGQVYWEERDLDRIATYCEKDVLATVQLFLRLKRLPLLHPNQVVTVR